MKHSLPPNVKTDLNGVSALLPEDSKQSHSSDTSEARA